MLIILHICFSPGVKFDHKRICEISSLWNRHCVNITTNGGYVVLGSGQIVYCGCSKGVWLKFFSVISHIFKKQLRFYKVGGPALGGSFDLMASSLQTCQHCHSMWGQEWRQCSGVERHSIVVAGSSRRVFTPYYAITPTGPFPCLFSPS